MIVGVAEKGEIGPVEEEITKDTVDPIFRAQRGYHPNLKPKETQEWLDRMFTSLI